MRNIRGFTLVEVLVVLIIFGLVIAMAAAVTRGISAGQQRTITVTRLATVDAAIIQFVSAQKRLPCPADGTLASTDNNAGLEIPPGGGGCGTQTGGVVPWRTLGLAEQDATDGWYRRFTYRVDPQLGITGGMDMSFCDPVGLGAISPPNPPGVCNPACTSSALASCTTPQTYLQGKGLRIQSVNTTVVMDPTGLVIPPSPTGAAYVTISAGSTGGGGYLNTGVMAPDTGTDGTEEKKNHADVPYGTWGYYVDDTISDTTGTAHFDDLVSRPSISTVITKAALGPRSH